MSPDVPSERLDALLRALPKVELHVHLEGTLEPELMFVLARRNGVGVRFASVAEARRAYQFGDLQAFLDLYYEGARALVREDDFYDLTWAYLTRAATEGVRNVEPFFDPRPHTARGVGFETVVTGIRRALADGQTRLGLSSRLIMCFLRHLPAEAARATLREALTFRDWIAGVGLDSSERDHPPAEFARVFAEAHDHGFLAVAHAGEEGPPEYVWQALDRLHVSRIDHGVRALEDPRLVERLGRDGIPLTICPLSNVKLGVVPSLAEHPLRRMLDLGLRATVNSDDPAYFGGYVLENYRASQAALGLGTADLVRLCRHAAEASFLDPAAKRALVAEIETVARSVTAP